MFIMAGLQAPKFSKPQENVNLNPCENHVGARDIIARV